MSVLLQQNRNEGLLALDGTAAPFRFKGGIPYEAVGAIALDTTSPIDHYHQGLPFSAAGRLCVSALPPARFNDGAMPLDADGKLSGAINVLTNLYVNPTFQNDGTTTGVPDNHSVIFGTAPWQVDLGTPNKFNSNTTGISGRAVLTYSIATNNPALTVGNSYRISYEIQNANEGSYSACVSTSGASNVTVLNSATGVPGLSSRRCWIEFSIDADPYEIVIRAGCGTTANNTSNIIVSAATLYDLDEFNNVNPVVWNGGVPYNDAGSVVFTTVV